MASVPNNSPEDLDARVDALLREMDTAHDQVRARLDSKPGAEPDDLADLAAFEAQAKEAAQQRSVGGDQSQDGNQRTIDGELDRALDAALDAGPLIPGEGHPAASGALQAAHRLEPAELAGGPAGGTMAGALRPSPAAAPIVLPGEPSPDVPAPEPVAGPALNAPGATVALAAGDSSFSDAADDSDAQQVGEPSSAETHSTPAPKRADLSETPMADRAISPPAPPPQPVKRATSTPEALAEFDERLASALGDATEDEFADASDILAGAADLSAGALTPTSPAVQAPTASQAGSSKPAPTLPVPIDGGSGTPGSGPGLSGSMAERTPASAAPVGGDAADQRGTRAPANSEPAPAFSAPVSAASAERPAAAVLAVSVGRTPQAPATPPAVATPKPPKPAGPTAADVFWRVVTPIIEPIAMQLGRLPVKTQQTFGWIGLVTLFTATMTWVYVFVFMPSKPPSHAALERAAKEAHSQPSEGAPKRPEGSSAKPGGEH